MLPSVTLNVTFFLLSLINELLGSKDCLWSCQTQKSRKRKKRAKRKARGVAKGRGKWGVEDNERRYKKSQKKQLVSFSVKLAFVNSSWVQLCAAFGFLLSLKPNHWFNWNFLDSHRRKVVHPEISVWRSSWNHQICQVAKALMCVIPLTVWPDVTFSSYSIIIHTDGRSGCQVSSFNCVVFDSSCILWGPEIRVNVAESTSALFFFPPRSVFLPLALLNWRHRGLTSLFTLILTLEDKPLIKMRIIICPENSRNNFLGSCSIH